MISIKIVDTLIQCFVSQEPIEVPGMVRQICFIWRIGVAMAGTPSFKVENPSVPQAFKCRASNILWCLLVW